jgi:hypothetical protein
MLQENLMHIKLARLRIFHIDFPAKQFRNMTFIKTPSNIDDALIIFGRSQFLFHLL